MNIAEYALAFLGRPYIWGGDGSGRFHGGFDCSGLVVECLQATGWLQGDHTAQGIYTALKKAGWGEVALPHVVANDILFFGKDTSHITHVAICCSSRGGGSMWRQVGEAMKNASSISSRLDRAISRCNRLQEGPCGSTLCTLSQHFAGGGGGTLAPPGTEKAHRGHY